MSEGRGPGRPRVRPVEEERRRILAAARSEIAARDFHGATIDQVARTAGVARRAVYEQFGSKEELFRAVMAEAADLLTEVIQHRLREGEDLPARERVRYDVAALFDFNDRNPEVAALIRNAERGGVAPAREPLVDARRRIEQELGKLIEQRWEEMGGGIPTEAARLLALGALTMVEAAAFRQPVEPGWTRAATIELITEFMLGGFIWLAAHRQGTVDAF